MRLPIGLLGMIVLGGCAVPRNASPVALGVPDGMVLGRDPLPSAQRKIQRVTYAFQGERHTAVVAYGSGDPKVVERREAEKWIPDHSHNLAPETQVWVAPGEKRAARAVLANLD